MKTHLEAKTSKLNEFESTCRRRGVPLTWQRRAVYEALLTREDHPTADQLYEDLKPRLPGLSRTTVYRVLETLVDLGVASRTPHPGAAGRFDAETRAHHHLLCRGCGRLVDVEPDAVPPVPTPLYIPGGFEILDASVYFHGWCRGCRDRATSQAFSKTQNRRRSYA